MGWVGFVRGDSEVKERRYGDMAGEAEEEECFALGSFGGEEKGFCFAAIVAEGERIEERWRERKRRGFEPWVRDFFPPRRFSPWCPDKNFNLIPKLLACLPEYRCRCNTLNGEKFFLFS